jgi:DNA-binding PadR family transcriptional regulator
MTSDPVSYLPLTEPTFYILLSLAPGKKHGYAIMKDVATLSGQKVTLSTSTLYSALGRLLDQGLIERTEEEPGKRPGLPRKAYILTDSGRRILEAETNRMQNLVTAARLRLDGETA